ncbi:oxidoreductase [Candidatus Ferrigenium straubiae]|jgi:NADPH2:quinone reductase|uniref:oxidoreductase n=1 Tax=Candidatus Ferrigenium straubiae TaxID=2919506 RepID=UPI003F4AF13D
MSLFRAYRIFEDNGKSAGRFVELALDDLDPGEVVIRVHYSSVNYKDALAATGAGRVVRRFPCVGGVDAAGVVASSSDARYKPGDEVLVTGYGMGVDHDGGFAEYARVPADWVVLLRHGAAEPTGAGATASHLLPQAAGFAITSDLASVVGSPSRMASSSTSNVSEAQLPQGLTLFDAMAIGTAGFAAALSIHRLEQNELRPESGKVIVTGATGGVASLAIQMLAQLGYHVVALTGKEAEHEYLKSLGVAEILPRKELVMGTRPLEKAQWAGALDAVGGETLAWLTRTMQQDGVIASFGNAGGIELHTTVIPFILRGVRLIGIDSAATAMPLRREIWRRLASDLRPKLLAQVAHSVPFAELPQVFPLMLQGRLRGRTVVGIK